MAKKRNQMKEMNSEKLSEHITSVNAEHCGAIANSNRKNYFQVNTKNHRIHSILSHTKRYSQRFLAIPNFSTAISRGSAEGLKNSMSPRTWLPDQFDSTSVKTRNKIYLPQHISRYYRWIYTRGIDQNHVRHILLIWLTSEATTIKYWRKIIAIAKQPGRKLFDTTKSGIQFLNNVINGRKIEMSKRFLK